MFNVGGGEMIFLAILALLVFGPEGLPGVIKTVSRTVKAFRQAANDFQTEVNSALTLENEKRQVAERRRKRVVAREQMETSAGEDATNSSSEESPPSQTLASAQVDSVIGLALAQQVPGASTQGETSEQVHGASEQAATSEQVHGAPLQGETSEQLDDASTQAGTPEPTSGASQAGPTNGMLSNPGSDEGDELVSAPAARLLSGDEQAPEQPLYESDDDDGPGLPMARTPLQSTASGSTPAVGDEDAADLERVL